MKVKQISVFLENTTGRLREVTSILAKAGVNIRALSLADTAQFGILRLIVNDHEKAMQALQSANLTVKETYVIAVETKDEPGGLSRVLEVFETAGLNVEYMYAFVEKRQDNAVLIFRIENADKAIKELQAWGYRLLSTEDIQKI